MTDPSHATSARSDLDDEALDWFVRSRAAPHGAREARERWLAGSPARAAAFARWQADWRQLDALPAAAVQQLRCQLEADKAQAARQAAASVPARGRWWQGWTALAPQAALAAVVLALTGGGSYLAWEHWQQQPLFAQSFETQRGQQLNVQLPDGSRLRLDTATRIDVRLYRQRREVFLPEGQVVFSVEGDSARPFDVLAGTTRVTVVGTRFSVRNTAGSPVSVAVEEGRVRVAPAAAAHQAPALLLGAGQQFVGGIVGTVAASGIAPWRDGRITLDNLPLSSALAEFERYGPTRMRVRDPAVAALRVSGTFDPRQLENFRRSLPLVLPVRLQENGAEVEIVARP
ncbi:MAG: FecR domain-containing protein [Comamonas sp.]